MAKKLQVFVSSTFVDLQEERQAAVEGILLAGHIPAGMELFTAGDQGQLEVITRWIKASDVYMLILGGRYGTIDPTRGLSYTEIEYEIALAQGMPMFAVVADGPLLDSKKHYREPGTEVQNKYEAFRARVLSRVSKKCGSLDQIQLAIQTSVRDIVADRPNLAGWIRSTDVPDLQPLVQEIAELRAQNGRLREDLATRPAPTLNGKTLAGLSDPVSITVEYQRAKVTSRPTWGQLLA